MANVLKADCSVADAWVKKSITGPPSPPFYVQFQVAVPSATPTALASLQYSADLCKLVDSGTGEDGIFLTGNDTSGGTQTFSSGNRNFWTDEAPVFPVAGGFTPDAWHTIIAYNDGVTMTWSVDGIGIFSYSYTFSDLNWFLVGGAGANNIASEIYYIADVRVGTTPGGYDLFHDAFASGTTSAWGSSSGSVSVVADPFGGAGEGPAVPPNVGRVLIAWDNGPLEPSPTWTAIDQGGAFPDQFVSGYDIKVGRQTLVSQTDTGTATVYINDHEFGLFDDRNMSSPYQGKLSGRQIKLQLYDPVAATWEEQFGGLINRYSYDIDGSASDANGDPINASIQLECVDMFDYLNGYGLTPGLDGVTPRVVPSGSAGGPVPAGYEDGVYYAETAGSVDDRIIEILADANVDPTRYLVASGNTAVIAVKYDPGESALTALRDAADAEFPFIANIYVDRHGDFAFRGRYSRFDPDGAAAEPGSTWDFTRWGVGDEKAILADPLRAQMRSLTFSRDRANIINVAGCWPQGLVAADMPNQFFADSSSLTAYGQHAAPPMSDLLTSDYKGPGTLSPGDGKQQCYLFAKLLVKNQAFPREEITSLQVKAIHPADYRAEKTWEFITKSDISHIVNVRVGYPGGTGFAGDSPADDYYIEGRAMTVRPLNPDHDYVEYNVEVTPAVWSMDTHSVFPAFDGSPILTADFTTAE